MKNYKLTENAEINLGLTAQVWQLEHIVIILLRALKLDQRAQTSSWGDGDMGQIRLNDPVGGFGRSTDLLVHRTR